MRFRIERFSAWAPGLETEDDWRGWAEKPEPLGADAVPDAKFLPAMLRRRCTPLSKIQLKVAFACVDEEDPVRTVFASRHGSINESIALLENVARDERISPAVFSHTVHNAQAGLFSIAAQNREASSSLAGGEDSFASGLVEALAHLSRDPERAVLLVMGDVPLAPTFAHLVDEPRCSYGVALRLRAASEGIGLSHEAHGAEDLPGEPCGWPAAAEFLRGWLSGDAVVTLKSRRHHWRLELR